MGSSNKKLLAPAAGSGRRGNSQVNVYRGRSPGGGRGERAPAARAHPATAPRFQSARWKKKKKKDSVSKLVRFPTPSPGGGREVGEKSAWSSQCQPAEAARLPARLGLRKLPTGAPMASAVQPPQRRGVRVSVSLPAGLALARARPPALLSGSLPPSLASSRPGWELPPDPARFLSLVSMYGLLFFFCPFSTWRGPGCGARVARTPGSAPPDSSAPGAGGGARGWRAAAVFPPIFFFFNTPLSLIDS